MIKQHPLPPYVQRFFTERLVGQLNASPHTIAGYRDTFRMLLRYAEGDVGRAPTQLLLDDIDADLVGRFLIDLEDTRGSSARTRNTRLAAIRSFFKYVAVNEPQLIHHCQRILSMPQKRYVKRTIDFLTYNEVEALLDAPDETTWFGRRDRTILQLMVQTGLRASEALSLKIQDVELGHGAVVRCLGKGRKERATPLRSDTVAALEAWLKERGGDPSDPLFVSIRGGPLSRDALERIVRKYAASASQLCATLTKKRVTPHVLRHTAAMQLLQNGVDRVVIALWLGHESVETTQMYIHADIELKEKAMAKTEQTQRTKPQGRYIADDNLLQFLEEL